MLKNLKEKALRALDIEDKVNRKSGYVVDSVKEVPHFYGLHKRRVRKEIALLERNGEIPDHLQHVKVLMVQVKQLRYVDRSKYNGARLRQLRLKHGVGRRPTK